ncbi:WXG100 family type VII secretion target [Actinomyces trachealis]|uniref:WXG100 family type VII secretion target n=1 Tax=Actinomyces trachealis TaxID=2763540 RepID=UPI001892A7BC|nr:WXG100 family type VII secretion target [Actinomyces trachealis]
MSTYTVDTNEVSATAARTRARICTIQNEVDAMNGDLATLQSSWTGSASNSMGECGVQWHATQLQVQSNLHSIGQALDQAAFSYDDAETSNRNRFTVPQ